MVGRSRIAFLSIVAVLLLSVSCPSAYATGGGGAGIAKLVTIIIYFIAAIPILSLINGLCVCVDGNFNKAWLLPTYFVVVISLIASGFTVLNPWMYIGTDDFGWSLTWTIYTYILICILVWGISKSWKVLVRTVAGIAVLFLPLGFFTDGVVSFRYQVMIDNEFEWSEYGFMHLDDHVKRLDDGRILRFKYGFSGKDIDRYSENKKLLIENFGSSRCHAYYTRESKRWSRSMFNFRLIEEEVDRYFLVRTGDANVIEGGWKNCGIDSGKLLAESFRNLEWINWTNELIEGGADVNYVDPSGYHGNASVIHAAVYYERIELLNKFIGLGSTVNGIERDGETPIYKAVYQLNYDAASCLISAGADLNIENKNGKTVLDALVDKRLHLSRDDKVMHIFNLLDSNGARAKNNGEMILKKFRDKHVTQ
ncbi:MAG: ankyrin repeat domain-containing protein [Planctomycetes bacterium]|nr:ankyrin repeat domain-containing protein [Planctomycetota bacterium]